jgi:hypothetical protein
MTPRRYALLIPLVALAACAGGSTMRVSQDDPDEETPVALAPTPESPPDSITPGVPLSQPSEPPLQDSAQTEQGYIPYGDSETSGEMASGEIEIRRIGQWTHTGISEARRLVIRDANAWTEFWSELGVGDRPAVDFSQDLVIAVAAGQRPTGGHEIAVTQVNQSNGELRVELVETTPGPNCMTTSALTQPVDVVVVKGVNPRSWSFVQRKEVRGCR